jgi:hypothetical protein
VLRSTTFGATSVVAPSAGPVIVRDESDDARAPRVSTPIASNIATTTGIHPLRVRFPCFSPPNRRMLSKVMSLIISFPSANVCTENTELAAILQCFVHIFNVLILISSNLACVVCKIHCGDIENLADLFCYGFAITQ